MGMSIQNRSVLYEQPVPALVPEGVHEARLVNVRRFANAFGDRIGLVFEIVDGRHAGATIMQSARPANRGKLAELLHGMGAVEASTEAAERMIGRRCRIAVRHDATKAGRIYEAIVGTFPAS